MPERTFQKNFKTKRRIMRSFKMVEISGVDRPAQEGAKVVIAKRAPDAESFAKASFREIMDQKEREKGVCEAFYEAFEDQWTANDAFRQALSDSYQDGEEAARQYVDSIAEMAFEAVAAVRETGCGDILGKSLYFGAVADAAVHFTKRQEAHPMFKTLAALKAAIAKYQKDGGTAEDLKVIQKSAIDLDALAELTGDLAIAPAAEPKANPEVDALKREVAVLKLSDRARSHFDGLDEAGQTAFLAKSASDQDAEITAAQSADPVVYKCADGTEIRKSDGAAVLAMAKRGDRLEAELAKAKGENEDAALAKRAREEFAYLPAEGTAEMLKAADAITDPEKKKKMLDAMRACNTTAAKKHKSIGSAGPDAPLDGEGEDATDALDKMAGDYAKANNVSVAKAYDAVLKTEEGAALYAKSIGSVPAGEAD